MLRAMQLFFILASLLLCIACTNQQKPPASTFITHEIAGRDDPTLHNFQSTPLRYPVYRAKAPSDWQRHDPNPSESIVDSTKAICEFIITDNSNNNSSDNNKSDNNNSDKNV